ncbi:hypothetical protein L6164_016397 [Bauhinia variegata]|uniref:Uncharacterized protein n=1 Tax=Bauhinia variegata TaxID=167791 RepID=A0ACB9NPL8_BAUVA|nr:hypothetical protein L6164_016397 [Bauhinia variegata]
MLCSAPAGKSGSNWLDRLRSIKGIPTGDDLDLDFFLSNSDSAHSNSDATQLTQKRARNRSRSSEISSADGDRPMSSVLAELFNMGGSLCQSSKLSGKKCPRKQTNPKFFVASSFSNSGIKEKGSDGARKDDNVPAAMNSFNNESVEMKEESFDCGDIMEDEKEKEQNGNELLGFSKSEVTVIDTSCPVWKVDKLVFRKNNVWKVREKKGKSKAFVRKKRKGTFGLDKSCAGKRKPKLSDPQFEHSLETKREEIITPSTQGQNTQHEQGEITLESPDVIQPPPKKRFPFSRSPPKSRKENSSVIHIKTIPHRRIQE